MSILISIQPYFVFLIIARLMGWQLERYKDVEVRKNFPKSKKWNKKCLIYCSQNKKSFNQIPKEYQPFMLKLLGKVIGEFTCNGYDEFTPLHRGIKIKRFKSLYETCLTVNQIKEYAKGKTVYGWRISDLLLYGELKSTCEILAPCVSESVDCANCKYLNEETHYCKNIIVCPPQSWCYVEAL